MTTRVSLNMNRSPMQRPEDAAFQSEEDYTSMAELDEENINWCRLIARALSILLLIGIIILVRTRSLRL
jgi:hypothetical protein